MSSEKIIQITKIARTLLSRLERISADSIWAHRASGIRGALLRLLDQAENDEIEDHENFSTLIDNGFSILEAALREQVKNKQNLEKND